MRTMTTTTTTTTTRGGDLFVDATSSEVERELGMRDGIHEVRLDRGMGDGLGVGNFVDRLAFLLEHIVHRLLCRSECCHLRFLVPIINSKHGHRTVEHKEPEGATVQPAGRGQL